MKFPALLPCLLSLLTGEGYAAAFRKQRTDAVPEQSAKPMGDSTSRLKFARTPPTAFAASPSPSSLRRFRSSTRAHATAASKKGRRRVVVTGMGVVNGAGVGVDTLWQNLLDGKSGVEKVKRFDVEGMTCQVACEVSPSMLDAADYFRDPRDVKRNDRFVHYAMAAAKMAMEQAGLETSKKVMRPEMGVLIGSGIGGIETLEQQKEVFMAKGHRRVSPFTIPAMILNTASGLVAIETGAQGPNYGIASACATGGHSIGDALRYIENGEADIMLCGGAEASVTGLSFAGFNNMRAMASGWNDDPKAASRPFDKKRSGFVMGEGAGVLVLESEESAIKRGAPQIFCDCVGYSATDDAHHITAPDPAGSGLSRCIERCLLDGGVEDKSRVGYINAHGTSTPLNDKLETMAYKAVFGDVIARQIPISSTKSMTGHTLGAAGGIEAIVAIKALGTGMIPPTINNVEKDPDCDLDYTPNKARKVKDPIEYALSDNLGFGGHNVALLFQRHH